MRISYFWILRLLLLVFLSFLTTIAYAITPSYSYLSLSYLTEKDNSQIDYSKYPLPSFNLDQTPFTGFAFTGSMNISASWFTELRYRNQKGQYSQSTTHPASFFSPTPANATTGTEEEGIKPTFTQISASLGYQIFQDSNNSIYISIGAVRTDLKIEVDQNFIFKDSSGNIVPSGGWLPYSHTVSISNNGELISIGYRGNLGQKMQFSIGYDDALFNGFSSNNYFGEFLYEFTKNYSLQLGTELASNSTQLSAGVRYTF